MTIKFKDGKEIEFKQFGNKWLAENSIFNGTKLNGSLNKLRELKIKVSRWFEENAPEEIKDRYTARLPFKEEIEPLPAKDQMIYDDERKELFVGYFLADEENRPLVCAMDYICWPMSWGMGFSSGYGNFGDGCAVRLCLEERQ